MQAEAMRRHEELLKILAAHSPQVVPGEKANPTQISKQESQSNSGNKFVKLEFKEHKGKGI